MKKQYLLILLVGLSSFIWAGLNHSYNNPASEFINSLSKDQYAKAVFSFNDNKREIWSFLPGAIMWRPGLKLNELSDKQNDLLFNLLKSSLSEAGYDKVQRIIELENILAEIEGNDEFRNADNYFVSFYGSPVKDSLWAWSFEGHHLSLKFTITPNGTAVVPRFMGASPATILSGPSKGERTLQKEEDYGIQLIQSMSTEQKEKTIFRKNPYFDIVTQNAIEVTPLTPAGISVKDLNENQRELLEKLIFEYLASLPRDLADERFRKIKNEDFENIRFSWAGATNVKEGHYYRVQGKIFLIEFDNFLDNANHIHTVWREYDGDFGRDLILEHYRNSDHRRKN